MDRILSPGTGISALESVFLLWFPPHCECTEWRSLPLDLDLPGATDGRGLDPDRNTQNDSQRSLHISFFQGSGLHPPGVLDRRFQLHAKRAHDRVVWLPYILSAGCISVFILEHLASPS